MFFPSCPGLLAASSLLAVKALQPLLMLAVVEELLTSFLLLLWILNPFSACGQKESSTLLAVGLWLRWPLWLPCAVDSL